MSNSSRSGRRSKEFEVKSFALVGDTDSAYFKGQRRVLERKRSSVQPSYLIVGRQLIDGSEVYTRNRNLEEKKLDFESGSTHLPNPASHCTLHPNNESLIAVWCVVALGFLTRNGSGPFEYSHVYEPLRHKPIENLFGSVRIGVFWRIVIEVREYPLPKRSVFMGLSARNDL